MTVRKEAEHDKKKLPERELSLIREILQISPFNGAGGRRTVTVGGGID